MHYKIELVLYYEKGCEVKSKIGYKVYSPNDEIVLFNEKWNEIDRNPFYASSTKHYTMLVKDTGYISQKFMRCRHLCSGDIHNDCESDNSFSFIQDKLYPLIERDQEGIKLMDELGKLITFNYNNKFYHYFTEI